MAALAAGLLVGASWAGWTASWRGFQDRAWGAGLAVYAHVLGGVALPHDLTVTPLPPGQAALADAGQFARLPGAPRPLYVTRAGIAGDGPPGAVPPAQLSLAVLSPRLVYPVAEVQGDPALRPPEKFAGVIRLLATYCGDPVVLLRGPDGGWARLDAPRLWSCAAAPSDLRLPATLAAVLLLVLVQTGIWRMSQGFRALSTALRTRRLEDGEPAQIAPAELADMTAILRGYLADERAQLAKRAELLSAVSHDLGTPATRVRLRAELIDDATLKQKLSGDIAQMTRMIDSVLTYTRSELSAEEPQTLSLSALVEALVADYTDLGQPVRFVETPVELAGPRSVFASWNRHPRLPELRRVIVTARPLALQRALGNLVDNALKYGRRASVMVLSTSQTATVIVEDEGGPRDIAAMNALTAPFRRGATEGQEGYGLGLAIAATVARQHGGEIAFEQGEQGLRVRFTLRRG